MKQLADVNSTARVRITPATKISFLVNNMDSKNYFKTEETRRLILDPVIKGLAEKDWLKWHIEVHVWWRNSFSGRSYSSRICSRPRRL